VVDTNSDPEDVDYPIAANDDSIRTIDLIGGVISNSVKEGREVAKARAADAAAASDQAKKQEGEGDQTKVRRQMRGRRAKADKS
jgi:small subunit ribosomal protein S2